MERYVEGMNGRECMGGDVWEKMYGRELWEGSIGDNSTLIYSITCGKNSNWL